MKFLTHGLLRSLMVLAVPSLALAIFLVDLLVPPGFNVWLLYFIPLALSHRLPLRRPTVTVAAVVTVLIFLGLIYSPASGGPRASLLRVVDEAELNRSLGVAAMWITASLMMLRTRTARALGDRELLLDTIITTVPDCVKILAPDGTLLKMNSSGLALLDADDPVQVVGQEMCQFVCPEHQDAFRELSARALRGETGSLEFQIAGLKGGLRWLESHAAPLRDSKNKVTGVVAVSRDITERKRSYDEIKIYETIFKNAGWGMVMADPDTNRMTKVNPAFARMHGYQVEEMIGMNLAETFAPEAQAELQGHARLVHQKGHHIYESIHMRKDGSRFHCLADVTAFKDAGGRVMFRAANFEDISERKRMAEALVEREERLRLFIEHSPVALAMFDREMRYLAASRRWVEDYKLSATGTLVGQSHYEVFPEIPEHWKAVHRRCLAGAVEKCEEEAFDRADGHRDWLRWEVHPWRTSNGDIGGIVIFTEDITERKGVAEALRSSEAGLAAAQAIAKLGSWELDVMTGRGIWSREMFRLFARDPALGAPSFREFLEFTHPKDRMSVQVLHERLQREGGSGTIEFRLHPDRGNAWLQAKPRAQKDERGRTVKLVGSVQDITELKRAGEALQARDRFTQSVLNSIPAHIAVLDRAGTITAVNTQWAKFASANGSPAESAVGVGANYLEVCRKALQAGGNTSEVHDALMGIQAVLDGRIALFSHEYSCHSPRELRWFSMFVTPVPDRTFCVVIHFDISERRRMEMALREAQGRVQQAQEEERKRIAREIHDDLGQQLTLLRFGLSRLAQTNEQQSDVIRQQIHDLTKPVDQMIDSVRRIATRLRPGVLDDLGLHAALEWLISDFRAKTGLICEASIQPVPDILDDGRITSLFRITQEALTNIARHAQATRVTISLRQLDDVLMLDVHDNGRGLSQADLVSPNSIGIFGMRERASLVGGRVTIRSNPDDGTTIIAQIPLGSGLAGHESQSREDRDAEDSSG